MTEPKSVEAQPCKHCHGQGRECWCPECQGVAVHLCTNPASRNPYNADYFKRMTHPCSACGGTGKEPMEP